MDASGYRPVFPSLSLSTDARKQTIPVPRYLTTDAKAQQSMRKLGTQIQDELSDRKP